MWDEARWNERRDACWRAMIPPASCLPILNAVAVVSGSDRRWEQPVLYSSTGRVNVRASGVYLDPLMRGGHAGALWRVVADGRLICLDRDPVAVARRDAFAAESRVSVFLAPFPRWQRWTPDHIRNRKFRFYGSRRPKLPARRGRRNTDTRDSAATRSRLGDGTGSRSRANQSTSATSLSHRPSVSTPPISGVQITPVARRSTRPVLEVRVPACAPRPVAADTTATAFPRR